MTTQVVSGTRVFMIRPDISNRLIHLTKGESNVAALHTLLTIVTEHRLIGGTGGGVIRGGYHCVCLCETPISHLALVLANKTQAGFRYRPFGVMFSKQFVYEKGGRPVIYGEEGEFDQLPDALKYRHVRYDPLRTPKPVDFTWEREWRIHTNQFEFSPDDATIVFPNREVVALGIQHLPRNADGTIPWHFVALEDLGVDIDVDDPEQPAVVAG
jgi:hypothetical protein